MAEKEDRLVQLWISHNEFFWQQVRAMPFVEALVLGGGYTLYKDGYRLLSISVLLLGAILFLIIGLMINRHREHAKLFRKEAGSAIPNPGNPFLGIRSDSAAVSIPFILAAFNIGLVYFLYKPASLHFKYIDAFGLSLDFIGIILLLIYSEKTIGATTKADKEYQASSWWFRSGYILIALGFLIQIFSGSYNAT